VVCPQAPFTQEAGIAKYGGTVTLLVVVTPEGRATDIKVIKGLQYGLEQSAIDTVQQWRFAPARDPDGNPVGVRQTIEVIFHPYPRPY
jgi:TonB family protein